jgi:hypothetical protein
LRRRVRRSCSFEAALSASRTEIPVSQEEIAAMANIARTTANMVVADLANAGFIKLRYEKLTLLASRRLRATLVL